MILYKKDMFQNNKDILYIKIYIEVDDTISIDKFLSDINIKNIDFSNYEKLSDNVYNNIPQEYYKFKISIEILINDVYGYKKIYDNDDSTLSIIHRNNDTSGIIISNGISINTYNINEIPDDIKKLILSKITSDDQNINDNKKISDTSSPVTPNNVPQQNIKPPNTTQTYPETTTPLPDIPDIEIPNDVDEKAELQAYIDRNQQNDNGPPPPPPGTSPKKLDISGSPVFNNLFDQTLSMMDNIGPSPDLIADMSNPEPAVSNKIKDFFGKKH